MGLFSVIEQVDKRFLKDHFGDNDEGNLYKAACGQLGCATLERRVGADGGDGGGRYIAGDPDDQTYRLTTNEDDPAANTYEDLARLVRTIDGAGLPGGPGRFDSAAFREPVEAIMNARAFLRWAGVNILIGGWDNYFATPSNYFLYNSGRRGDERGFVASPYFTFIPWDYDNSFGVDFFETQWQYTDIVDWPSNTDNYGRENSRGGRSRIPLVQHLLRNRDFLRYHLDHLEHLLDTVFNPAAIAAAIGAGGLWDTVAQAAYLESDSPTASRSPAGSSPTRGLAQRPRAARAAPRGREGRGDRPLRAHAPRQRQTAADRAPPGPPGRRQRRHVPGQPGATAVATGPPPTVAPLRALFQRRVDGDDALLRLARLRFAQAGLAAEVYADTPEQLEWILGFAPSRPHLPVVHLGRGVNLLDGGGRAAVQGFADRFAGRVAGLVVHDKAEMATRTGDLVAGIRELDLPPDGPVLLLEYAAGLELDWFVEVAERLREVPRVGACVDVGHVGIAQARASFSRAHPGLDLAALDPGDGRLPGLAADVEAAVASALSAVLGLLRSLGEVGKPIHLHLHDGHPLIPGLSDHFSFLIRVPVPFDHQGRRSRDLPHPRDPSGRGPPPPWRRRRPVRALARPHQRRADEPLAGRPVRERAARDLRPGRPR
jgi:hypothetical protein